MADANVNEELAQLQYLHEIYVQQYGGIMNELERYSSVAESFSRSTETIEKIGSVENSSILLGIDAGAFVEVRSGTISKVITSVGAGYMVEKSVEEAKAFIKANADRSRDVVARLIKEKEKVEREIVNIEYRISTMQQR